MIEVYILRQLEAATGGVDYYWLQDGRQGALVIVTPGELLRFSLCVTGNSAQFSVSTSEQLR